jgi:FecR protein/Glucodextranase, domain B
MLKIIKKTEKKDMKSLIKIFLFIALSSAMILPQTSQRAASIQSLIGFVKVRKGDNPNWKDARVKMPIKEKDAVRTFVESETEIITSEGTIIRLAENTTMELSTFKQLGNSAQLTKVSILNGTVVSNIKKLMNSGSKFEFETPSATASIRGTQVGFDVSSEKTLIKVYEGEVVVTPKGAKAGVSVKTNQMTTIIKGQTTPVIEALSEKDKKAIGIPDSTRTKDTTHTGSKADTAHTGSMKTDTAQVGAVQPAIKADSAKPSQGVSFILVTPTEGQKFTQPMIPVGGTATAGSEVTINGTKCPVAANGSFSTKIPIPDEENEITLDIEATLNGLTQKMLRNVSYKPGLVMTLISPQNQQLFNTTSIPVTGQLTPPAADLTVSDAKIPVSGSGKFAGFVFIPDEEGQVTLNFEASYQGQTRSETRTIVYQRLCDQNKPTLTPSQFPAIAVSGVLPFTVLDRTPDDEITFYKSIDGSRTSETGQPNSSFNLELEEGVHNYILYAQDKCGNKSQVVSGSVAFLKKTPLIQVRKPLTSPEVIHIPPSAPNAGFNPIYTVEFSVLNLPDNDTRLIKEASVRNDASGQVLVQSDLIDLNSINFDITLKRGINRITVQVKDINNNQIQSPSPVIIDVH